MIATAASTLFGGINDIGNNWAPPHKFHRIGTDVDIDDARPDTETKLRKLKEAGGLPKVRVAPLDKGWSSDPRTLLRQCQPLCGIGELSNLQRSVIVNNRTLSAVAFGAALFLALGAFPGANAAAQVGDICDVTYPGWIPSDRVDPTITVQVTCDPVTDLWTYEYMVANGANAEQDILEFSLRFDGPETFDEIEVTPPPGW